MNPSIHSYILTRLSRGAPEDDIIYAVCRKTGLAWPGAQMLVDEVRNDHLVDIEARQMPLRILLSGVFFFIGILLTVGPIIYLWVMLDVANTFFLFLSGGPSFTIDTAFALLGSRCALLGWLELPTILFTMLSGLAIMRANYRYVRGIWEAFFT